MLRSFFLPLSFVLCMKQSSFSKHFPPRRLRARISKSQARLPNPVSTNSRMSNEFSHAMQNADKNEITTAEEKEGHVENAGRKPPPIEF
jgi:hypothetical protein